MTFCFPFVLAFTQIGYYSWFFRENELQVAASHKVPAEVCLKTSSDAGASGVCNKYRFLTSSCDRYPNLLSSLAVVEPLDCFSNCLMAFAVVPFVTNRLGLPSSMLLYVLSGSMSSFAFIFSSQFRNSLIKKNNDALAGKESTTGNSVPNKNGRVCHSSHSGRSLSTSSSERNSLFACTSNGAFSGLATVPLLLGSELKCRGHLVESKVFFVKVCSATYLAKCLYEEWLTRKKEKISSRWSLPESKVSSPSGINVVNSGILGGIFYGLMHHVLFSRTKMDMTLKRRFYKNLVQAKWR